MIVNENSNLKEQCQRKKAPDQTNAQSKLQIKSGMNGPARSCLCFTS